MKKRRRKSHPQPEAAVENVQLDQLNVCPTCGTVLGGEWVAPEADPEKGKVINLAGEAHGTSGQPK